MMAKAKAESKLHVAVNRDVLLKQLTKCSPFVEHKTTIPILANFLLEADGCGMTIQATDLDTFLAAKFEAKVKSEGQTTVPARMLLDTVKRLVDVEDMPEEITVRELENNYVTVECGTFKMKIVGMAASSYPAPEPAAGKSVIQLPANVLNTMIEKTRSCIRKVESRYTINGALLNLEPELIRMIATDGHRLAVIEKAVETTAKPGTKVLLTSATIDRLKPFVSGKGNEGQTIGMEIGEAHVFLSIGDDRMTCRLMTGQFPDWGAVLPLPNANNKIVRLDSNKLASALKLVSRFADERSMAVRFELLPGTGLKLYASSAESGDASQTVAGECETPTASPVMIGFDARYVLDWLRTVNGSGAKLSVRDSQSAGLWEPLETESKGEGYSYRTLIMPLRVEW